MKYFGSILLTLFLVAFAGCKESSIKVADDTYILGVSQEIAVTFETSYNGTLRSASSSAANPVFLLASSPANGTLTLESSGSFVYTPNSGYAGPDTFTFKVRVDAKTSEVATVNVTVIPGTDSPISRHLSPAAFLKNVESLITLSYTDSSGDLATSCALSNLTNITITTPCLCDGLGVCTVGVTGTAAYTGPASFTYNVTAGGIASNESIASLRIISNNSAPTLTSISTLSGATEATPFTITYNDLLTASNAADPDADPISFRIEAISGTLTKTGVPVVAGTTLLASGQSLTWTPGPGLTGTLQAFSVKAWDGTTTSTSAIAVKATVSSVTLSITSITLPSNGYYKAGDQLDFSVLFNKDIETAPLSLPIIAGTGMVYATHLSRVLATHTYRYTVASGQDAPSGIDMAITNMMMGYVGGVTTGIIVDTTAPTITGITNDLTPTKSKSWTWGCSETCTYRSVINTSSSWTPAGAFGATTSGSQTTGNNTYYAHVQARDLAGNLSNVLSVSAIIDNTAPAKPTAIALVTPASSPGTVTTPVINVNGVTAGDNISLHTTNACLLASQIGTDTATATNVDVTVSSALAIGTHNIWAKSTDVAGNESPCSTVSLTYEVQAPIGGDFPGRFLTASPGTNSVTTGDLNRDGLKDIVTADRTSHKITIFYGTGGGGFQPPTAITTGNDPMSVFVTDLDRDSWADLVTADDSGSVSIHINDKLGGFLAPTSLATGSVVSAFSIDLDLNSFPDLIVADLSNEKVTVFYNDGAGGYSSSNLGLTASAPTSVFSVDVNADTYPDVIALSASTNKIHVFLNSTSGGFLPPTTYLTRSNPLSVHADDLNADGYPEIITADNLGDTVTIFHNDQSGGFASTSTLAVLTPNVARISDLNKDGSPDIYVATNLAELLVFTNDGTGSFSAPTTYTNLISATDASATDANGDGWDDLMIADVSGEVRLLYNDGAGAFPVSGNYGIGGPAAIFSADFDKDGTFDVLVNDSNNVLVHVNNGRGNMAHLFTYDASVSPSDFTATDLDNDNLPDVVLAMNSSNEIRTLMNDGSGGLVHPTNYPSGRSTTGIIASDLNGDGFADLVLSDDDSDRIFIFENDRSGSLNNLQPLINIEDPVALTSTDYDTDGDEDLLVANLNPSGVGPNVGIFLNDGSGNFSMSDRLLTGVTISSVTSADLDGDSLPDFIATGQGHHGGVLVFINDGNGSAGGPVTLSAAADPMKVKASDVDGDGDVDLMTTNVNSFVTVYLNDGSGAFSDIRTYRPRGADPVGLFTADLDADGFFDILTADTGSDSYSVLLWQPF